MNSNSADRPPALHWLTVLRYPATLWVIMKHSLHNFDDPNAVPDGLRKAFMERGFLGVPFFFILSGFILAYNYPVIRSNKDYLSARAARILPLYYLALLVSVPRLLHQIVDSSFSSMLPKIIAFLTLTQAWIPDWTSVWNFPAWTLSCEFFFYSLLIWTLPLMKRLVGDAPKRAVMVIAGCFLFGLLAPTWFTLKFGTPSMHDLANPANSAMASASNFVKIFPLWHLAEFTAGVALCVGMRSRLHALGNIAGWLMLAGLVQVLSSVFLPPIFSQGTYCLPGFVLIVLGAAALPFPNLETARPLARALGAFALLLGNVSYAVYLFHMPMMFDLGWIDHHLVRLFATGEAGVWGMYVWTVVVATLIGLPLYWFYETPARVWGLQWLRKHWVEKQPTAAAALENRVPSAPTVSR